LFLEFSGKRLKLEKKILQYELQSTSFLQTACGHDYFTNPQPSDRSVQTAGMPDLNNLQSLLEAGGVN
jgi:hypothetical protein